MPTQRTRRTNGTRLTRTSRSGTAPVVDQDDEDARPRQTSTPPPAGPAAAVRVPTSAGARPAEPRWGRCRTCRHLFIAASLVAGDCPGCAGLVPLPLADEHGRFLPGLSHGSPSPSRPIAPSRWRDDVR